MKIGRGNTLIRTVVWLGVIAAVTVSLIALPQLKQEPAITRVALITADNDKYWERLIEGAETAADLYDVELTVLRADGSADKQTDMLIDTEGKGFGALAVSPVDPNRQALMLRSLGRTMPLVTVDSDCILSGRICFVGADNYAAGRLSGQMIKQARPDGARVLVVMGPLAKENGERRRQGIIDELLDRSNGPGRPTEPLDEVHGEGRYVVAATVTDQIDPEEAMTNVKAALEADPAINCVVGIFAYSAPAALEAIEELGSGDDITVLGFDDRQETLDAIESGRMFGTVAQDQYSYGFASVRLMADAIRGVEEFSIPVTEQINFAPVAVTADNLAEFKSDRQADTSASVTPPAATVTPAADPAPAP